MKGKLAAETSQRFFPVILSYPPFTFYSDFWGPVWSALENERACVSVGCRTPDRKLLLTHGKESSLSPRLLGAGRCGGDTRTWPWMGLLRVIWASPFMTQTWGAALLTVFARCSGTRCQLPGAELGLALLCTWALK